jgi:hypothetical protein
VRDRGRGAGWKGHGIGGRRGRCDVQVETAKMTDETPARREGACAFACGQLLRKRGGGGGGPSSRPGRSRALIICVLVVHAVAFPKRRTTNDERRTTNDERRTPPHGHGHDHHHHHHHHHRRRARSMEFRISASESDDRQPERTTQASKEHHAVLFSASLGRGSRSMDGWIGGRALARPPTHKHTHTHTLSLSLSLSLIFSPFRPVVFRRVETPMHRRVATFLLRQRARGSRQLV